MFRVSNDPSTRTDAWDHSYSKNSLNDCKSIRSHMLITASAQNGYISKDRMLQLVEFGVNSAELQKVEECSLRLLGGGPAPSKPAASQCSGNGTHAVAFTAVHGHPINGTYTGIVQVEVPQDGTVTLVCDNGFVKEYTCKAQGWETEGASKFVYQGDCYKETRHQWRAYYTSWEFGDLLTAITINQTGTGLVYHWVSR